MESDCGEERRNRKKGRRGCWQKRRRERMRNMDTEDRIEGEYAVTYEGNGK